MNKTAFPRSAIAIIFLSALAVGCNLASKNSPAKDCPAIQNGLAFLNARYNPDLGLLNEAPTAAPDNYWLTNDNALAAHTLDRLGQDDQAALIQAGLERYGSAANGLIEVVWGTPVAFPPLPYQKGVITNVGIAQILQEVPVNNDPMSDWAEYTNLAFLGILNYELQGRSREARELYQEILSRFDGTGFRDKAFQGNYETYKLAMALYTGEIIGAPNPTRDQMLSMLLAMQGREGGFHTHYEDQETPAGDMNTETTSWALLALHETGCQ